jgi:hypothetical protein
MADNAFLMIHDPWCLMMGNSDELRRQAELLDKIAGSLVGEYVKKSGQSRSKIKQLMADETWFSAKEALDDRLHRQDRARAEGRRACSCSVVRPQRLQERASGVRSRRRR